MVPLEYQQGDHICSVYDSRAEQLTVAAEYMADGLRRGERCLYVDGSAEALDEFRQLLARTGTDPRDAERRTALLLLTTADAHLLDGYFSPERMLSMLNTAVEEALNAGFPRLRTCGDMSWLLQGAEGSEKIVEYEALLNPFFERAHALGMCQYDRQRIPAGLLDHAIATHLSVHVEGQHRSNPFCRPTAVTIQRQARPEDVNWKLRDLVRQDG